MCQRRVLLARIKGGAPGAVLKIYDHHRRQPGATLPPYALYHPDTWKAFHTLIWQQREKVFGLGRESDGEAFACVSVGVCVRARACTCALVYDTYTLTHSVTFAFVSAFPR